MFANPGGPGDTGVGLVQGDPDGLDALGDGRFDVLSWDPRGTHASTRVKCFTSQRSESRFWAGVSIPTTKAESEGFKRTAAAYARRCGEVSGWLLPHISTADTVRDLEHLRVLMGEEKLTYLGLSYGTYLGQTYANMFGDRIRAMMLNGIVDPVEYSKGSEARLAATVRPSDAVYDQFLALCDSAGPERCALAGGRHTAAERFDRLSARLKRAPIPAPGAQPPLSAPQKLGYADLLISQFSCDQGSQDVADQCRESRRRAQRRRIDARERGHRLLHARRLGPHNAVDGDPVRRRERPPEIAGLAVGDREIRSDQPPPGRAIGLVAVGSLRRLAGPRRGHLPRSVDRLDPESDPVGQLDLRPEYRICQRRARRAAPGQRGPDHPGGLRSPTSQNPSACVNKAITDYLTELITPPRGTVCQSDQQPFDPDFVSRPARGPDGQK